MAADKFCWPLKLAI